VEETDRLRFSQTKLKRPRFAGPFLLDSEAAAGVGGHPSLCTAEQRSLFVGQVLAMPEERTAPAAQLFGCMTVAVIDTFEHVIECLFAHAAGTVAGGTCRGHELVVQFDAEVVQPGLGVNRGNRRQFRHCDRLDRGGIAGQTLIGRCAAKKFSSHHW